MIKASRLVIAALASFVFTLPTPLSAQRGAAPAGEAAPATIEKTPPPATKLEGFKPAAGSVSTLGYDELGTVSFAISVDVRQMVDAKGNAARGLLVEVTESQYRRELSFVDADEVPELLKGLAALLEVKANPTPFKNFEVRYTTRGALELVAFNNSKGSVQYAVRAGRTLKASKVGLDAADMVKLRGMFEAASLKLNATAVGW